MAAWRQAGVSLAHYSYSQFSQVRRIADSELQAGDLVFYFGSGAHHVGMYIGGGKMVHAANPRRDVLVSDIDGPWYDERLSGFREGQLDWGGEGGAKEIGLGHGGLMPRIG